MKATKATFKGSYEVIEKQGLAQRNMQQIAKIVLIKINIAAIGVSIVMYEDHSSGQEPLMVKTQPFVFILPGLVK